MKNKNKKRTLGNRNPDTIIYTGPYKLPAASTNETVTTETLHFQGGTIASTAAGAIQSSVNIGDPSGSGAWAKFAAIYDEYRILSALIEYQPVDRYDAPLAVTVAINQPPLLIAVDRDSNPGVISASSISAYESCRMVNLSDPFSIGMKMNGVREAAWQTTAGPSIVARGFVWSATTGSATVSTTFGYFLISWIIQFRGPF